MEDESGVSASYLADRHFGAEHKEGRESKRDDETQQRGNGETPKAFIEFIESRVLIRQRPAKEALALTLGLFLWPVSSWTSDGSVSYSFSYCFEQTNFRKYEKNKKK